MPLGELRRARQQRGPGGEDAAVLGDPVDRAEEWRHRLGRPPCSHGDIGHLITGKVQGGEGGFLVFEQCARRLVIVVVGIESREQDARVEEERGHAGGRARRA